ncbi:MAG: OmpW family outer membrane protein [Pseudomonadota bacterium]|jgi:Outer membrane protein W
MNGKAKPVVTGALALALAGAAGTAAGADWIVRVGGHYVDPKSNNHEVVSVDSGQSPSFSITYQRTPHWGIELLGALPFKHDVRLKADGSRVAEVKHLPPTLTVRYDFLPNGSIRPYAGAGINATLFFDESTRGALADADLSLDTSFGAAAQAGVDIDLRNGWFLNLDARWIDIDSEAHLSGNSLGKVHIDPLTVGIAFGYRFGQK